MIATSKNESDMPKKKVNYTSSKEMTRDTDITTIT
jgi:hypothetical protein